MRLTREDLYNRLYREAERDRKNLGPAKCIKT